MLVNHLIGLIIPPSSLDDDGTSCFILRFRIIQRLLYWVSGWVLCKFNRLLLCYDVVKVDGHSFLNADVMLFAIISLRAFASDFGRWKGVFDVRSGDSKGTTNISFGFGFLFVAELYSILHIDESIKVFNRVKLLLLFLWFRFRFGCRFAFAFGMRMKKDRAGDPIGFHNEIYKI